MQDTYQAVKDILTKKLGIVESEITTDANLVKDLGIDSLDYAEIVMEFEQTFDIKIPDQDAEKLSTVGQSVNYIDSKLAEKQSWVIHATHSNYTSEQHLLNLIDAMVRHWFYP